ncbi:MAG: hypothetical protein WC708_11830 [Lentisphaeria bacterium]
MKISGISLVTCIMVAASAVARAALIESATGLTNPAFTITFSASPQSDGTQITNQYSGSGVTFDGTTGSGVYSACVD